LSVYVDNSVPMISTPLRAKNSNKIGVIYGFQNAAMVGTNPVRVDIFANLGVRVIQLTYNPANALGDGSMAPENRGLTPLGHEVVERLNANRVMVDLSHSGQTTCLEAARASKQPISINHTGCRALNDLPRNRTDEELRLVATQGGFVGIYFMPFLNESGHGHLGRPARAGRLLRVHGGISGPLLPHRRRLRQKQPGHVGLEFPIARAQPVCLLSEGMSREHLLQEATNLVPGVPCGVGEIGDFEADRSHAPF